MCAWPVTGLLSLFGDILWLLCLTVRKKGFQSGCTVATTVCPRQTPCFLKANVWCFCFITFLRHLSSGEGTQDSTFAAKNGKAGQRLWTSTNLHKFFSALNTARVQRETSYCWARVEKYLMALSRSWGTPTPINTTKHCQLSGMMGGIVGSHRFSTLRRCWRRGESSLSNWYQHVGHYKVIDPIYDLKNISLHHITTNRLYNNCTTGLWCENTMPGSIFITYNHKILIWTAEYFFKL